MNSRADVFTLKEEKNHESEKTKKIEPKLIYTISIVDKLDQDLMADQSSKSCTE